MGMTMTQEDLEERETERDLAAEAGHELGCFEWYAEVAIERGIVTDGLLDELTDDGTTLMVRFAREAKRGDDWQNEHCHCTISYTAAELAAEAEHEASQPGC